MELSGMHLFLLLVILAELLLGVVPWVAGVYWFVTRSRRAREVDGLRAHVAQLESELHANESSEA
jgi:hypothetical protein